MNKDERLLRFCALRPPLHTFNVPEWLVRRDGGPDVSSACQWNRGSLQTERAILGHEQHRIFESPLSSSDLTAATTTLLSKNASADILSSVTGHRFARYGDRIRRRVLLFELWTQLSSAEQGDKETTSPMDPAV